jgi:hypothetical protein
MTVHTELVAVELPSEEELELDTPRGFLVLVGVRFGRGFATFRNVR